MDDVTNVGVADLTVSANTTVLASYGLGSCVAVAMFDSLKKIGGMAHVMLPDSKGRESRENPGKFADTAVRLLFEQMLEKGARRYGIRCKIAGGAKMFDIPPPTRKYKAPRLSTMEIGARNVEAVKKALDELRIPLVAEDTGKNYGRTVKFDTSSGDMIVSSMTRGIKQI